MNVENKIEVKMFELLEIWGRFQFDEFFINNLFVEPETNHSISLAIIGDLDIKVTADTSIAHRSIIDR